MENWQIDIDSIFRLLESTRKFLEASEELSVENEAINSAIGTFGLKKQTFDMFEDNNTSDDSNLPSTSSQSPSSSRQHHSSSSTSSTDTTLALESEAINSAIGLYGLHKNGI